MIGALLYLAVCTRRDLSFPVSTLARHLHAPTTRHMRLTKRVIRYSDIYVSGTLKDGLHFPRLGPLSPASLGAAVDAD